MLSIFGAVTAVFGIGGSTFLEISVGNANFKTSQVGLSILIIGALLSFFTAINLPPETIVLGEKPTFMEKLVESIPIVAVLTTLIGFILLVVFSFFGL